MYNSKSFTQYCKSVYSIHVTKNTFNVFSLKFEVYSIAYFIVSFFCLHIVKPIHKG